MNQILSNLFVLQTLTAGKCFGPCGHGPWKGQQNRRTPWKSSLSWFFSSNLWHAKNKPSNSVSKVRRLENGATWFFYMESCMFWVWFLHMQFMSLFCFSWAIYFFSIRACIEDHQETKRSVRRRVARLRQRVIDAVQSKVLPESDVSDWDDNYENGGGKNIIWKK